MKKINLACLAILIAISVFALAWPALAAAPDVWGTTQPGGGSSNFTSATSLGNSNLRIVIGNTIRIIIGFLGIIAVVGIVAGGFIMMTAGGDEDKVGTGKKAIVAGVIGLVIILFAYAIASFVLDQINAAALGA